MTLEAERIKFLIQRDGPEAARQWVERTLEVYRQAVTSESNHASRPEYRAKFTLAIREFEEWLAEQTSGER
jgi:hypothetical protein